MRSLALAAALSLLACAALRAGEVVVVQGTLATWPGYSPTRFQADRDSLGKAAYMGFGGDQLRRLRLESMRQQADLYEQAQRAQHAARGGQGPAEVLPLYVILDEAGTWAYAYPTARFRVRDRDIQAPALVLGMQRRFQDGASPRTEETDAANVSIRDATATWWEGTLGRGKLADELALWVFHKGEPGEFHMGQAHDQLGVGNYLQQLDGIMRHRLKDGDLESWTALKRDTLQPLAEEASRVGLSMQILRTISHELGHLIHFAAVGPENYRGAGVLPHLEGSTHSQDTLSSPEFAFTEGFAMANSMFVLGTPSEPEPFHANRVDYAATRDVVRKRLEAAARAGQAEHPEARQLAQVAAYLDAMDARVAAGDDRKRRYDFLRSEYAVGALLAKLRKHLGREDSWRMTRTLAARTPATLAGLLEGYVADATAAGDLDLVRKVYEGVAEFSQGILVTPVQAALFRDPAFARAHAIDLDRDGAVPAGRPAHEAQPGLFPAEDPLLPGIADPLRWDGGELQLYAGEGTSPAAAGPRHGEPAAPPPKIATCPSCAPATPAAPGFEDLR